MTPGSAWVYKHTVPPAEPAAVPDPDPPTNYEFLALEYVHSGVRDRMMWINSRKSDLSRHLLGVMAAAERCMDHGAPIEDLDVEIARLVDRVAYVRGYAAAAQLAAKRSTGSISDLGPSSARRP